MELNRRKTLVGAAAFSAALVCEPVAAVVVPLQSCGCPRVHELSYGHTCTVHDETGRRWDSYSTEEIAKGSGHAVETQTDDTEWSCYCGRHADDMPPTGTKMVWEKVSYEYDEWDCHCADAFKDDWLSVQTTDWIEMAKRDGFA